MFLFYFSHTMYELVNVKLYIYILSRTDDKYLHFVTSALFDFFNFFVKNFGKIRNIAIFIYICLYTHTLQNSKNQIDVLIISAFSPARTNATDKLSVRRSNELKYASPARIASS